MTGRHALVLAAATTIALHGTAHAQPAPLPGAPNADSQPTGRQPDAGGEQDVGGRQDAGDLPDASASARGKSPWIDIGGLPLPDVAEPYDQQYRALVARDPHYLRLFLEEMGALGVGVIEYWVDRKRAITNFDYPSFKDRFTLKAWRFDNNGFLINHIGHPLNGMSFHMLARANGLSLPGSILAGFATSMTWELGWEFREKVSINDTMVTTGSGATMGEWVHWIGKYLESAPAPRPWHRYLRWTLGLPAAVHNAIDDRDGLRKGTRPDNLGFSSDIWHRFEVAAGSVHARPGGDALRDGFAGSATSPDLRLRAELVALPGFLRPGYSGRTFGSANVTSLQFKLALAPDVVAVELDSDTFVAGILTQSIDEHGGSATLIGIDLAYRVTQDRFAGFTDKVSQMHFPGLGIDQYLIAGGFALRARARLNVDFAGVHAAAYPAYLAAHPDVVDKAILRKQGYYFGWGASTRLDLEAHTQFVTAGIAFRYGRYDSQEGYDRNQEEVTDDVDATDTVRHAEAWLRIAPAAGAMYLEARASDLAREGRVGDETFDQSLRRYMFSVGISR